MLNTLDKSDGVDMGLNYATENDYHLRFFPLDELETIRNAQHFNVELQEYHSRGEYSYLKDNSLNIESMGLTDKQLMAVSLVFYGGLKKKVAARIMKISSQALSDHLKAGLKKMGDAFK
jgi:predicted DNA-binding protein (UPF0251 family)